MQAADPIAREGVPYPVQGRANIRATPTRLTGSKGRPIQIDDGEHDLAMIARKVAFAFRIMAQRAEAEQIEDPADGGD